MMETLLIVAASMAIAAFIGGWTNFLAIKMLFHPREPLYIGSWRIPFTPGIIPKRKDEIAVSLGKVVSGYLVTEEGIRGVLRGPAVQTALANQLTSWLERAAQAETTWGELLHRYTGRDETYDEWKRRALAYCREQASEAGLRLWRKTGLADRPLGSLAPDVYARNREYYAQSAADWVVDEVQRFLLSPEGERWLQGLMNGLVHQTGGFKGMVAQFILGDPQRNRQIRDLLLAGVGAAAIRNRLRQLVLERMREGERITVDEAAFRLETLIGDDMPGDWGAEGASGRLIGRWIADAVTEARLDALLDQPLGKTVAPYRDKLASYLPALGDQVIGMAEQQLPAALAAIDLPKLVEREIESVPVIGVERIVLEVTGKEFRAITWLGAALGGLIGLLQSVFYLNWLG